MKHLALAFALLTAACGTESRPETDASEPDASAVAEPSDPRWFRPLEFTAIERPIGATQAASARSRPSSWASAVKFVSTVSQPGWLFGQSVTGRTPIRRM